MIARMIEWVLDRTLLPVVQWVVGRFWRSRAKLPDEKKLQRAGVSFPLMPIHDGEHEIWAEDAVRRTVVLGENAHIHHGAVYAGDEAPGVETHLPMGIALGQPARDEHVTQISPTGGAVPVDMYGMTVAPGYQDGQIVEMSVMPDITASELTDELTRENIERVRDRWNNPEGGRGDAPSMPIWDGTDWLDVEPPSEDTPEGRAWAREFIDSLRQMGGVPGDPDFTPQVLRMERPEDRVRLALRLNVPVDWLDEEGL